MGGSAIDFRRLKAAVPIARFLAVRGLTQGLCRRGHRLVGPCPIHRGDNPTAFQVDLDRNLWYCHTACGGGGDIVDLVRKLDGVGYAEAARRLAAVADEPDEGAPFAPPSRSRRPFCPYTRTLHLDARAPFLQAKGITPATARRFEAGAWHGPGFLQGCVGVRLHDDAGRPLGYAGRRLDPDEASRWGKWKFPVGLPKAEVLFGRHRLGDMPPATVVVTECPWGVLRLTQINVPAVALLGTALSAHHRCRLAEAEHVVLLFDGDRAGAQAAVRARSVLAGTCKTSVVDLPAGADPDDLSDEQLSALLSPFFLS